MAFGYFCILHLYLFSIYNTCTFNLEGCFFSDNIWTTLSCYNLSSNAIVQLQDSWNKTVSQLNIGKLQTNLLLFAVLLCKVRLSRQRPLVTPLCLILNLTVGIIYKLMLNAILHFTYEIVTDHLMTEHLMIFSTLGSLSFTYECSP